MSKMNYPDNWVVLKIITSTETFYKLLCGWSGGYTTGDSWKMNSGIVSCELDPEDSNRFLFSGYSGSVYSCHKESYCLRMNNAHVYNQLKEMHGDKVGMLDDIGEEWLTFDWR